MLTHLFVKDFAIVREVDIAFGPGMTVLSGETGAGKSLLVDALMLLSGSRADLNMVRYGAERADLLATFKLDDAPTARGWLQAQDLEEGDQCQLRRVIRADGGSRAWINGRPSTLTQLSELAANLIEIHGQHEHQALLDRESQLALLDAYAKAGDVRSQVAQLATLWREAARRLDELRQSGDVSERIRWLRQQLYELDLQAIDASSITDLQAAYTRQNHAVTLLAACDSAYGRLTDDGTGLQRELQQVRSELVRVCSFEPRLKEVDALFETAQIQFEEASNIIDRIRDEIDLDPSRLTELETRLGRLHDLARRHRVPLGDLDGQRDQLASELEAMGNADNLERQLLAEKDAIRSKWSAVSAQLSAQRRTAACSLCAAVSALMLELEMAGGRFEIEFMPISGDPNPLGSERLEFMVSANPGQPLRALRRVASGGELARIALAIEVAALGLDDVPTMIFDEVDSGIGGAVAEVVGRMLQALGSARQVLCVTHLAQVAAQADHHLIVRKVSIDNQIESQVEFLSRDARVEELSRMLGGIELTAATRALAAQMLGAARGG